MPPSPTPQGRSDERGEHESELRAVREKAERHEEALRQVDQALTSIDGDNLISSAIDVGYARHLARAALATYKTYTADSGGS